MQNSSAWFNSIRPSGADGSEVVMNGLRFFVHNDPDAVRVELGGSLHGTDVETVYQAWQRATLTDAQKPVIVDVTFVIEADEHGRALLLLMHRFGARIIAESPESSSIVRPIVSQSIEAADSKSGWFHWLITFLLEERPARAALPAQAEIFYRASADNGHGPIEYARSGDLALLENGVR